MTYVLETSTSYAERILIVSKKTYRFTQALAAYVKSKDTETTFATTLPARPDSFALTFLVNTTIRPSDLPEYTQNPLIYVLINAKDRARKLEKQVRMLPTRNIKIVHLARDDADNTTIEQLIWFAYSHTDDVFFDVLLTRESTVPTPLATRIIRPFRRSKRRVVIAFLALWFIFMGIILGLLYASAQIRLSHLPDSDSELAKNTFTTTRAVYEPVRPFFFLFSMGLAADSLINTNDSIDAFLTQQNKLNLITSHLVHTITDPSSEKLDIHSSVDSINAVIHQIDTLLNQPEWILKHSKETLSTINDSKTQLQRYVRILHSLDDIFVQKPSKTYAVIIANDTQLSPGGGTIQAIALVQTQEGHVRLLQTIPAGQLDQTLATSLAAPESMQTFAHRSFLTLTNALVEPQLDGNAQTISTILENERKITHIDGYLLVTDAALSKILGDDSIYLANSHEKISRDSLRIKLAANTQNEAFVREFVRSFITYLGTKQANTLFPALDQQFLEKQMAFLTSSASREIFSDLYWDGQLISPRCVIDEVNCAVDVLGVYHANITPNYSSLLVAQSESLKTTISDEGVIRNELTLTLTNDPQHIAYPQQTYESYVQLILPRNTVVESITDNTQKVEQVLSRQASYALIAFPVSVAPQKTHYLTITYTLPQKLKSQHAAYQLILQKQLGAANTDFTFELILPKSFTPEDQNFHPVVNSNRIFYNNVQNTDRIFVITLNHHS